MIHLNKRHDDMNITNFINKFEQLNNQIKHYNMELPTGVLTYGVLKMQIYPMKSKCWYEQDSNS